MKINVGQKAFDYMMEASGKLLKLSEISRESDIGVADELNTIASNMADFANTILEDGRTREEEIKTYTITVEKEAEPIVVPPTFWEKVQNWFAGVGGWIGNNSSKIQTGGLMFCSGVMFVLSIYLVIDYKKYKTLVAKLKQLTEVNSTKEQVQETSLKEENNNDEVIQEEKIIEQKKKTGRHF